MVDAFLKSLAALTCINVVKEDRRIVPGQHAAFFVTFSLVGFAIGVVSMVLVRQAYGIMPELTAWFIPVLWLGLTGSKHMGELYRTVNALSLVGTVPERLAQFSRNVLVIRSMMILLLVFSGKVFALLQSQALDPMSLSLVVLFVPMFSRYTAAVFAFGSEGAVPGNPDTKVKNRFLILLLSSTLIAVALLYQLTLGVLLLVVCMLIAVVMQVLSMTYLKAIRPAVLGAIIEISELMMLWVVAIFAATGMNVIVV